MASPGRPRAPVLVAFALSGAAALAYEVVWTRSLSVVLGSTTHALSSMLATFMLGLAIGGWLGGRLSRRAREPLAWLGACELGIGVLGALTLLLLPALPRAYLALYRAFHLEAAAFFVLQILLCSAVMLGPTVLMGMTFPLVTARIVERVEDVGAGVGAAYAANTVGSVAGALLAGFALVPRLGLRGATLAAAAVNVAVGAFFLVTARGRRGALLAGAGLLLCAALGAGGLAREAPTTLVNFYSAYRYLNGPSYDAITATIRTSLEPLYRRDGVDASVAAYRVPGGNLLLTVGGKIEGTLPQDEPNTLLLAYLPAAAHPAPRRALVVGLGAGVTLDAAREVMGRVDLAELSAEVIEAVRRHGPPGVLDGVTVHRDDARSFLLRTEDRFDVITSEPSYPTEFAVANLFTRDYYALAAERLAEGGIYCQWLPAYMLASDDVAMLVKTFGSVFPHATLWKVPSSMDLLLLGSLRPFARSPEEIRGRVAALEPALEFVLAGDVDAVRAVVARADVPVHTDDLPLLEFRVARSFRTAAVDPR